MKSIVADQSMVKELLKQKSIIIISKDEKRSIFKVYDSRDYESEAKRNAHIDEKAQALRRMKAIDDVINIDNMLSIQSLEDIERYCLVPKLANAMKENIITTLLEQYKKRNHQTENKTAKEIMDSDNGRIAILAIFRGELCSKAEYLDLDEFLRVSIDIAQKMLESKDKLDVREIPKLESIIHLGGKLIEENRREEDITNFVLIQRLREQLFDGKMQLSEVTDIQKIRDMQLNEEEKIFFCMKSASNVIFLLENELIDPDKGKKYLTVGRLTDEEAKKVHDLKRSGILTAKDLINIYLNGSISLKKILEMQDDFIEELSEKQLIENIRLLDNHKISHIIPRRYITLYKAVIMEKLPPEEKDKKENEILTKLGKKPETREIIALYKNGILSLRNVIRYTGEQIINVLLTNGALKPKDLNELMGTGRISQRDVEAVIKGNTLTNEEKFLMIISAFNRESQTELRNRLYSRIDVEAELEPTCKMNLDFSKTDIKETFYFDPGYRLQLLLSMDSESSFILSKEGYAIIKLPSHNKVIVERMFQHRNKKIENASGEQTYIFNEHEYKNANLLMPSWKINRTKLNLAKKLKKCDIYYHSASWGDKIADAFDARDKDSQTEEHIAEVNRIIKKIQITRELR